MLGWLGADPNSDIAAHGAGFLCGICIAVPMTQLPGPLPSWAQDLLKLATIVIIMLAWRAAMHVPL